MNRKGISNCFAISLRFRFAIQLETRLEPCLQWLLRSCQLEELNVNNWLQSWSSLRCCSQSVHVYQNCLEQSQKHVYDGTYDYYNYMEARFYWPLILPNEIRIFAIRSRYLPWKYDWRLSNFLIPSNLWFFVLQWNSLEINFWLMTWWTRWLSSDTELMTYAETVPSWFLLNLKVVQVT